MRVPAECICKTCGFPTDSPNHELGCGLDSDMVAEEIIALTLPQAAEQALFDLQQWTKDHAKNCKCFTCSETIPDLSRSLGDHLNVPAYRPPHTHGQAGINPCFCANPPHN